MRKANRFHVFVDVNRKFLASGTIVAGKHTTDVTVNVEKDEMAAEAALTALLTVAHAIATSDDDHADLSRILARLGLDEPSPVKESTITAIEAAEDWLDEFHNA